MCHELLLHWYVSCSPQGVVLADSLLAAGDKSDAERELQTIFDVHQPVMGELKEMPYVELQQSLAAKQPEGLWYERGILTQSLHPDLIAACVAAFAEAPLPSAMIGFLQMGGAVRDVAPNETAYYHRTAEWWILVLCNFQHKEQRPKVADWCRTLYQKMASFACGSYSNVIGDMTSPIDKVYGNNLDRLQKLKQRYDAHNFFHHNRNIVPKLTPTGNM